MVKTNTEVRKAASELFHRFIEIKEIDVNTAKTGAKLLEVIQKSFIIDGVKHKLGIELLPSEQDNKGESKMFVKKINI